jgi:Holliday junction resolvase RusA-like endonuclease
MALMALDEYTPISKNSWKENANDDQENSMAVSDLQRQTCQTRTNPTQDGASTVVMHVTFKVEATPVGKGRPKFARRGNFVSTYTPTKTRDYEDLIKVAAKQAMGTNEPLKTPVAAYIYITVPIPQSYPKKRFKACLEGLERPCKKPDIDNIIKAYLDAMNGIVYDDDTQVVSLHSTKVYGTVGLVDVLVKEDME